MMKKYLLSILLCLQLLHSNSQQVNLVANLQTVTGYATLGNHVFFVGLDLNNNGLLRRTDGPFASTIRIDSIPGGGVSHTFSAVEQRDPLVAMGNTLYFFAFDNTTGFELCKYSLNDTLIRTVKDIRPGAQNSIENNQHFMVSNGNSLFFPANANGGSNPYLYKSDGTDSGTVLVKNVRLLNSNVYSGFTGFFVDTPVVYFSGSDGTHSYELWRTDGTTAGTYMIKDIDPVGGSEPHDFVKLGNDIFFLAKNNNYTEQQLWKTDGTAAGTVLVKGNFTGWGDIYGTLSSAITATNFAIYHNELYFAAKYFDTTTHSGIWKTDGTTAGTTLVKNIYSGNGNFPAPLQLTVENNKLFFIANDSVHGEEIWVSNGTTSGTHIAKDINPGTASFFDATHAELIGAKGKLYATGVDGTGRYLFSIDASSYDTIQVQLLSVFSVQAMSFYKADSSLYFHHISRVITSSAAIDSVYPGDANHDAIVDNSDVLALGLAYNDAGLARPNPSINYTAQFCQNWVDTFSNGINTKHADCNGNGIVNADDTTAIIQNFQLVNPRSNANGGRQSDAVFAIHFLNDTIVGGDTLVADVLLGDLATSTSNVYGLSYSLHFDPAIIDTSFVVLTYSNSWLANASDKISLTQYNKSIGQINSVVTRIDHNNQNGGGAIARLYLLTKTAANVSQIYNSVTASVFDLNLIDNKGSKQILNLVGDTALVIYANPNAVAGSLVSDSLLICIGSHATLHAQYVADISSLKWYRNSSVFTVTTSYDTIKTVTQAGTYYIKATNYFGIQSISDSVVITTHDCNATSIGALINDDSEIRVYPNPASAQFFIQTNGIEIEQVNIYNTTGMLMQSARPQTVNFKLETGNLASGVYIAEIRTKEASVRRRWLKM